MVAIVARYRFHLKGRWRAAYVVSSVIALYLNVFVLIAQLYLKVPALRALSPNQSEPPFLLTQGVVLVLVVVLGIAAVIRFGDEAACTQTKVVSSGAPGRELLQRTP